MKGSRLDERLVDAGLAPNRTRAQALIRTGDVLVDDRPIDKPGTRVPDDAVLRLRRRGSDYVSRGGDKLAGALDALGVPVAGRHCLDVGASTGGFSDCLLKNGAASVTAVDVGYGQLHPRLRADPRVHVLERTNARHLAPDALPVPVDLVTVDASFISLRLLLPALQRVAPGAELLLLVKPQFEVGRGAVGKGGVVRDPAAREAAAEAVREAAAALGYRCTGQVDSGLAGPKGNVEIFLWLTPGPDGETPENADG